MVISTILLSIIDVVVTDQSNGY